MTDQGKPGDFGDGGEVRVYFQLFGVMPEHLAIDGRRYHCRRIPPGMALDEYERATQPAAFELVDAPDLADGLAALGAEIEAAVRAAPQSALIHGTLRNPYDPDDLRDATGLAQYLLDNGSVALLDLMALQWYTPETWRDEVFNAPDT